jgi:hypothetical protein
MTNAAQCEKFHPFAVSAMDRLRSRSSSSLGTQQSAGAGCNSIQSSRRAWREYREAERIYAKSFGVVGWYGEQVAKEDTGATCPMERGGESRLSVNSIQSSRGGPQGCGRVVAAWLRGIGKSCSPRDPFLRHRVGTFDAFLPCELGRRREATPSAAGPFLHVRGERASSLENQEAMSAEQTHRIVPLCLPGG